MTTCKYSNLQRKFRKNEQTEENEYYVENSYYF